MKPEAQPKANQANPMTDRYWQDTLDRLARYPASPEIEPLPVLVV